MTAESLRRLLKDRGYQILRGEEVGSPDGSAWTETGDLDALGHYRGRTCGILASVSAPRSDLSAAQGKAEA